jgi:MtrB/PioB family decaheme-associated outer membrane protein
MSNLIERRLSALCMTLIAAAVPATAKAVPPDTSNWKCEFCPFERGTQADYTAGGAIVDNESARFGNANGYDDNGGYLIFAGQGSDTNDSRRVSWVLDDLGLDSRALAIEVGSPGAYDISVAYRGLPYRLFGTTETVFSPMSGGLDLPAGWNRSALTSGLTDLATNLAPRDIDSNREILQLDGGYRRGSRLKWFASYRQQKQDGVNQFGGTFFSQASILPRPFDYRTDEVDLGVRYQGRQGHAELGLYSSLFQNKNTTLVWQNPFTAFAGAEQGAVAEPPDNSFSQVSVRGGYNFSHGTRVLASAAFGVMEQDEALLGYTVNPLAGAEPLPQARLDGEVDTTNLNFSIASKPLDRLRLNFSYRYDERDNGTPQATWSRVIVDSLLSGDTETNLPYSFERSTLAASASLAIRKGLKLAAGIERRKHDRDFQEVAEQTEDTGWSELRWRPNDWLELSGRGGTSLREIDRYDTAFAVTLGQNPLLRKYNLAHRFREFGEFKLSASFPNKPIAVSATAAFANDDYSKSLLGLLRSDQIRYAVDASWAITGKAQLYLTVGSDETEAVQGGSSGFRSPDWRARHADEFMSYGMGFRVKKIRDKLDIKFDYHRGLGSTQIDLIASGGGARPLPRLESTLDSLRLTAVYRRSVRQRWVANLRFEHFDVGDWALEGVSPGTIPTVLTLGPDPYSYDVIVVGMGFSYRFGDAQATAE